MRVCIYADLTSVSQTLLTIIIPVRAVTLCTLAPTVFLVPTTTAFSTVSQRSNKYFVSSPVDRFVRAVRRFQLEFLRRFQTTPTTTIPARSIPFRHFNKSLIIQKKRKKWKRFSFVIRPVSRIGTLLVSLLRCVVYFTHTIKHCKSTKNNTIAYTVMIR